MLILENLISRFENKNSRDLVENLSRSGSQHEIIVDSKLLGDLVQAPGGRRLTSVSGRLPGIPGELGPLL